MVREDLGGDLFEDFFTALLLFVVVVAVAAFVVVMMVVSLVLGGGEGIEAFVVRGQSSEVIVLHQLQRQLICRQG